MHREIKAKKSHPWLRCSQEWLMFEEEEASMEAVGGFIDPP